MLREFIALNREKILANARLRVLARSAPVAAELELTEGGPIFLDQLGEALRKAALHEVVDHREIERTAGEHGDDLFHQGLSVAQVVHDYGDLCQVITALVVEESAVILASEFQTLNLCLDDAIAGAVTAFGRQRERAVSDEGTEKLGVLAHELRNALSAAVLLFGSIKRGTVAPAGSTGAMLERSHERLQSLIDRSLADVRLDAAKLNLERVPVWEVIKEAEIGGAIVAEVKGVHFAVTTVDRMVMVEADRSVLASAVANLLQNAFKFTRPGTTVKLRASATATRVLIEVEDQCGGLPPGGGEILLQPFVQRGHDRTGLGLGLSICVKAAKMMSGELSVRDLPGKGCVFTISLPKQPPPPTSIHGRQGQAPAEGGTGSGGQTAREAV